MNVFAFSPGNKSINKNILRWKRTSLCGNFLTLDRTFSADEQRFDLFNLFQAHMKIFRTLHDTYEIMLYQKEKIIIV